MSPIILLILSISALIISLVCAYLFKTASNLLNSKVNLLESQLKVNDLLINEIKANIESQQVSADKLNVEHHDKTLEAEQVIKQLDYRIQTLQTTVSDLQDQFKHAIEQQPEDKLYSRALKLAQKGADLEEIVKECELPQAEAEMLLSLYQAKSDGNMQ